MSNKKTDIYKNNNKIAEVKICESSVETGIGLLKTPELKKINGFHAGILMPIPKARQKFKGFINSIHMIGMKYPISVFWIDKDGIVVTKCYAKPGLRIYSPTKPSVSVIELDKDAFDDINVGDKLTFGDVYTDSKTNTTEEKVTVAAEQEENFSFGKMLFSGFRSILIVIAGWLLLNLFIQSSYVVGTSMENTLHDGDFLLGIRPWMTEITKGDIVTVIHNGKLVIKRVIGTSGDSISISDENGLQVNGERIVYPEQKSKDNIYGEWVVGEGKVFIAGDNREDSMDSRIYGEIPEKDITSKVILRYYPLNHFGGVN